MTLVQMHVNVHVIQKQLHMCTSVKKLDRIALGEQFEILTSSKMCAQCATAALNLSVIVTMAQSWSEKVSKVLFVGLRANRSSGHHSTTCIYADRSILFMYYLIVEIVVLPYRRSLSYDQTTYHLLVPFNRTTSCSFPISVDFSERATINCIIQETACLIYRYVDIYNQVD